MVSQKEWITAHRTLETMIARGEGAAAAIADLAAYLRLKKLRVRARRMWVSDVARLKEAWLIPADAQHYEMVKPSSWTTKKSWSDDLANWDWAKNRFYLTRRKKPVRRLMLVGVSFSVEDLKTLRPQYFNDGKPIRRRGPDPDPAKRSLVWKELLRMALDGELTDPVKRPFDVQTELETHLHETLNPPGKAVKVGQNIIAEVVRHAYPLFAS